MENADDCACAIFLLSGLKELRGDVDVVAKAFNAQTEKVRVLLATALGAEYEDKKTEKEEGNETD